MAADMFLLEPFVFWGLLLVLFIAALASLVFSGAAEKKRIKDKDAGISKYKESVPELESRESELRPLGQEQDALGAARKECEGLRAEQQQLQAVIESLRRELTDNAAIAHELGRQKQELLVRSGDMEREIARLKKELEISLQAHNGPKGQQSGLEDTFSRLSERHFLEEQKKSSSAPSAVPPEDKSAAPAASALPPGNETKTSVPPAA